MRPMQSLEGFGSSVLTSQFSGVEDYSSLIRTTFALKMTWNLNNNSLPQIMLNQD